MSDLIFHLGLTKTASSFLQKRVFNGKMNTLDRAVAWNTDAEIASSFQKFFHAHGPSVWRDRRYIEDYFDYDTSRSSNVLISHESLYNSIPFTDDPSPLLACEPYLLAARLGEISRYAWPHGDVKAFFFFRRQPDWLASIYAHISYQLSKPSQQDFESRVEELLQRTHSGAQALEYDLLIEQLKRSLGNNNVLALPYEAFDRQWTWRRLRKFSGFDELGCDVDLDARDVNVKRQPSEPDWEVRIPREVGHTMPGSGYVKVLANSVLGDNAPGAKRKVRNFLSRGFRLHMTGELEQRILSKYRESNRRTETILGIPLTEYGY